MKKQFTPPPPPPYNNGKNLFAIEGSTACGANCIMCPRDKFKQKHKIETMRKDFFRYAVDQCIENGVYNLAIGCFGDPYSDPHFIDRCSYMKENYPFTEISLVTTGHLFSGEKAQATLKYVDIVKISHYGITKETYESVHRGSVRFEDAKKNVDDFLSAPNRPYTIMTFLDLPENHHELEQWKAYYEPKADRIDIWKPYVWGGDSVFDAPPEKGCWKAAELCDCFIAANGSVQVCSSDYNRELSIGNLHDNTLAEILHGEKAKHVQEVHKNNTIWESDLTICKNCDKIRRGQDVLVYSNSGMKVGEFSQKVRNGKLED